jgi:hypothetical protein
LKALCDVEIGLAMTDEIEDGHDCVDLLERSAGRLG